jgi:hypothetical protein
LLLLKLEEYKLVFVAVGLVGILVLASPVLGMVLRFPTGEVFSELYLLGQDHVAEGYPFDVAVGQNYSVFVGVTNHFGSSGYYSLYAKFGNRTDPLPNATANSPSPLSALYEYRFVLEDNQTWEAPLAFTIADGLISGTQATVNELAIGNTHYCVNKSTMWDSNSTKFTYIIFFELWLYSPESHSFKFNNRFVGLELNFTQGS